MFVEYIGGPIDGLTTYDRENDNPLTHEPEQCWNTEDGRHHSYKKSVVIRGNSIRVHYLYRGENAHV